MCGICQRLGVSLHRESALIAGERENIAGITATSATPFLLEDFAGLATFSGKPIFNHDQVIGQLFTGRVVPTQNGVITFSFLDGPHTIGYYNNPKFQQSITDAFGYSPFSEAEKAVAREAIQLWDDLIPQRFREMNGNGADIVFANTTTGPAQAHAFYPGNGLKVQSDVWTADPTVNWTNGWLGYGDYGRTTLVHELGHTLGLSHPGNYNFGADTNGDGQPDPIVYQADAFYAQDTMQYSIMSYFRDQSSGGQAVNAATGLLATPQTPLLHDILAIQTAYGADPTTRTNNTNYFTYGGSNAGNAVYDLKTNPFPYLSVYDAGGKDTFDFSSSNMGVFVDLRSGAFSSATLGLLTLEEANAEIVKFNAVSDAAQGDLPLWTESTYAAWLATIGGIGASRVYADTGVSGITATSHRNISIAYNTTIENANGGAARDLLVGNNGANVLNGNGGNDVLAGLGGNDTLNGGDGMDQVSYAGAAAGVTVTLGSTNSYTVTTVEGTDTFISIEGLIGSDFNDTLTGNAGDNIINGGLGNDVLDGGAGNDILSFMGLNAALNMTLAESGSGTSTAFGNDTFSNFEGLGGGNGADTLTGNSQANTLLGDNGNDTLNGAGGNDRLYGEIGNDTLNGGDGADVLDGGYGNDVLNGGNDNDTLDGSYGNDQLDGNAGDDTLLGGQGSDVFVGGAGNDVMDGGLDADTLTYQLVAAGVTVNLANTGAQNTGGAGIDTIRNIENLVGTVVVDSLTGDANANSLSGLAGNDVLNGAGGDDTLNGGAGDDSLNGGDGVDTAVFAAAVTVSLDAGTATGEGTDTLTGIENVTGSSGVDTITGDGFANVLVGNAGGDTLNGLGGDDTLSGGTGIDVLNGGEGNDTLLGGADNDTLNGGNGTDTAVFAAAVTVNLETGTATGEGTDTLVSIENATGSAAADTLIGDSGINVLNGNGGNDVLDGGLGNDTLNGGAGFDTVTYERALAGVAVSLAVAGAHATEMGSDTFISIEGLTGSNFADTLTGDAGSNVLNGLAGNDILNGGDGDDELSGGLGNDTLNGGAGFDLANFSTAAAGVTVDLVAGTATGDGNDTLSSIEDVIGSSFDDTLTGTAGGNFLIGDSGNDIINGGGGSDTLDGGAGNDTLKGGDGNDMLDGGIGDDILDGGAGEDIVIYADATAGVNVDLLTGLASGGAGNDTISGIENVTGSAFNDTLIGNDASNIMNGLAGIDTMNGGGGDDTLFGGDGADVLNGGAGVDNLVGGLGADRFVFTNVGIGDQISDFTASATGGPDRIDLTGIDANGDLAGEGAFTWLGSGAFTNVAGQLRYESGLLQGDINGDGIADLVIVLSNQATLTAAVIDL